MASATWPASLPQNILQRGFREKEQPQHARSQMDVGPAKMRRRYTAPIKIVNATILVDSTQKAALETFYSTTLGGGVLDFTWKDFITGSSQDYRFTDSIEFTAASPTNFYAKLSMESLP